MYILFFLVLLISVFFLHAFYTPANVLFLLNTDENTLRLDFYWLSPLIHTKVTMSDYIPLLTVYLFNIPIFRKNLAKKSGEAGIRRKPSLSVVALSDISVTASYGFESPFYTGILSGALDALISAFENAAVATFPDFLPEREFFIVQASAKLNPGQTAYQLIKAKHKPLFLKRGEYYGSAQYN